MTLPAVLLLPGMMLDERLYGEQVRVLSKVTQVHVADLTHGTSIEEMAAHALQHAPGQFALVGLSMGGIVALELFRQARDRVTHLALLDTTARADSPQRREQREAQMRAVSSGQLRDVLVDALMPRYLARNNRCNGALRGLILEMALTLGPEAFCRQSIALRDRVDRSDLLAQIECPALVLCGREDELCPVSLHAEMARAIPFADLAVLAECGHLSPLERPEMVSLELLQLLQRPLESLRSFESHHRSNRS